MIDQVSSSADQQKAQEKLKYLKLNILVWASISLIHIMVYCSIVMNEYISDPIYSSLHLMFVPPFFNIAFIAYCIYIAHQYQVLETSYSCAVERLAHIATLDKQLVMCAILSNAIMLITLSVYTIN